MKNGLRWIAIFFVGLMVIAASRSVNAVPAEETFEGLLRRLEQTERTLAELERQNALPTVQSISFRTDEPAPVPPEGKGETADKDDQGERETSFDDRLKKLEEGWEKLDDAWSEFEKAEKKKKDDAAKKPTFKINGRIHADFWDFIHDDPSINLLENPATINGVPNPHAGNDPEDRFAFRRIRLETGGDILDTMLWRVQIDFNNPNQPEMKDVYFGFKNLPNNQTLLIGNQKLPYGLDQLNSSRNNVFMERPLVQDAFVEDYRRPGVVMYGNTEDEVYNWRYGLYYLEYIANDGRYIGDARQMNGSFRLASSPWYDELSKGRGYFHWGLSGALAKPDGGATTADSNSNEGRFRTRPEARSDSRWLDTGRIRGADWYEIIALESIFNVGPLQITGEYMHNFMQRNGFSDVQFHGGYVYVSYMLTGEHIPYERTSGTLGRLQPFENFFLVDRCGGGTASGMGAWGIAARYSYLDLTDADVLGGVGNSGTLAVNWYWNAYAKVQFDLTYGEIDQRNVAGFTSGDYLIAGTRFAVDF